MIEASKVNEVTKATFATALDKINYWDTRWCIHLNSYSTQKQIALFFKWVSRLGDGAFWYVMMIVPLLIEGTSAILPVALTMLTSTLGLVIYKALKHKTVRPRPYQVHQAIVLGERPLDHFSFPSGHTLHAVLFTIMLGTFFGYLLPILVPFMLLVALSRMVLGLHYPTDVLVGAGIGGTLALLGMELYGYIPL